MAAIVLIIMWGLLVAFIAWLLIGAIEAEPEPAGPPDPYATEVARFARDLADWDRRGRP